MDKYEVAQVFREMALLIELTDENPKKSIAYRRAASSIEASENFNYLLEKNSLEDIPGIGKKISQMIVSLIYENKLSYYEKLKISIPNSILELINVGLNVKKIRMLYENLKILSIYDLENALEQKKITGIKGFSSFFLEKLKKRLERYLIEGNFLLYPKANHIADILKSRLSEVSTKIEISGALRRKCEVINEISFVMTTNDPDHCRFIFLNHGFVQHTLHDSSSFLQVLLKQGINASLQIVEDKDFSLAFLRSTGNERHLKDLELEASRKEIYLSSRLYSFSDESNIYECLNLNFIPPELREGYGEVEVSKKNNFSDLIEEKDLKGTFHCHTIDSDGVNTIEEMVDAAKKMGWRYLGITDHSKSSHQANGLSVDRLISQIEWIRNFNKIIEPSFKVFSGIECDILKDGELDFDKEVLKELDFVIVSVHSLFKQEKDIMTNRMIKAIENPYTTMIGHLTGRLLRIRDPYKLDIPKVIDACISNNKIIELNSYPSRLDMDWRFWIQAKERGLKCSINPDAHSIHDLHNCHYGVNIARKGWLKKDDVVNTLNLKEMIEFLKKRKP
jgi:DNA polymerase (family 10)